MTPLAPGDVSSALRRVGSEVVGGRSKSAGRLGRGTRRRVAVSRPETSHSCAPVELQLARTTTREELHWLSSRDGCQGWHTLQPLSPVLSLYGYLQSDLQCPSGRY